MSDQLIQWLKKYQLPLITERDIMNARKAYKGLNVTQAAFTFSNGVSRNLVKLYGVIPVPYQGKYYNIPVAIWLMDTHPIHSPQCFVVPTADMYLKQSKSVDHVGKVANPPVYCKGRQQLNQPANPYPTQSDVSFGVRKTVKTVTTTVESFEVVKLQR